MQIPGPCSQRCYLGVCEKKPWNPCSFIYMLYDAYTSIPDACVTVGRVVCALPFPASSLRGPGRRQCRCVSVPQPELNDWLLGMLIYYLWNKWGLLQRGLVGWVGKITQRIVAPLYLFGHMVILKKEWDNCLIDFISWCIFPINHSKHFLHGVPRALMEHLIILTNCLMG